MHRIAGVIGISLLGSLPAFGQSFSSGSNGSDGPLNLTASGTFDPAALGLDADGDGVYHFTTINVNPGVTIRLGSNTLGEGKPVVWLAQGNVTISGVLDLNGLNGASASSAPVPAEAGAGGYAGGVGLSAAPATSGNGPGGGIVTPGGSGGGAGHITAGEDGITPGSGGPAYGNAFLLPLIGGSGGAGGESSGGGGGGGGGGAILIASDTQITVSGQILAQGGGGLGTGGAGSGGSVRLVAPAVAGSGTIRVGGSTFGQNSSNGRIRVEAFSHLATYNYLPVASASVARPGPVFLPATAPRIRATQIVLQGGATVPVPANPAGSYVMPDAVVDTIDPITVNVMAENVPLTGSTIELRVTSDNGGTMVLTTSTLTGTQASSTASLGPFSLPSGYSRFSLTITFDPQ